LSLILFIDNHITSLILFEKSNIVLNPSLLELEVVKVEAKSLCWGLIEGCLPHEGLIKKRLKNGGKCLKEGNSFEKEGKKVNK